MCVCVCVCVYFIQRGVSFKLKLFSCVNVSFMLYCMFLSVCGECVLIGDRSRVMFAFECGGVVSMSMSEGM